jgi:hypothetical protein
MLSKKERKRLEVKLADLERRHNAFIDAGMADTVWSKQIEELKSLLSEEEQESAGDDLEVNHGE